MKSDDEKLLRKWLEMLYNISEIDIELLNERLNPLGQIFSEDEKYNFMTAETKAAYRRKTAAVAYAAHLDEKRLASEYISLCKKPHFPKGDHVGYYIYKDYRRVFRVIKPAEYFWAVFLPTLIISVGLSALCQSIWLWLAAFLPFYAVVKFIADTFIQFNSRPFQNDELPKMELSEIPDDAKTLVVVSALLSGNSPEAVRQGLSSLEKNISEMCYTNNERNIFFCLLFDLKQSKSQTEPSDKAVLEEAKKLSERLNARFRDKVCTIVRKRSFSKTQQEFTGFERKRGAIEQLVREINGEKQDFLSATGNLKILSEIRYICALDSDTKPLMDTVRSLVSAAVHPLITPIFEGNRVVEGYGIIVPRITTKLESSLKTPFSRILGGVGGTCTYDAGSSDFYQSSFGESIFSGKGLIDVDAFYKGCVGHFPSECILSHDILEGSVIRTAYDGSVEFSDSFPQNSMSFFKRLERWYRGDVQNITFLFKSKKKGINTLSRIKLWDNVRRAVTPAFVMSAFIIGGFVFRGEWLLAAAFLSVLLPYIIGFYGVLTNGNALCFSAKYYSGIKPQATQLFQQMMTDLILLPKYAAVSLSAFVLALWRRFVSHKKLLQWTTALQAEAKSLSDSISLSTAKSFLWAEILSLLMIVSLNTFSVFLGVYFLAALPLMIYCNSRQEEKKHHIDDEQRFAMINEAERIFNFYNDFVNEKENFLPPDNVQYSPVFRIAHRTSPTNIGMYLVSLIAARDFGFIDNRQLFEKVGNTLSTIEKLEKFEGNLLNWYDTRTLMKLDGFVSSVDSGNFLCSLVALSEGIKEYGGESLCRRISKLCDETNLGMFYDRRKKLFSIGFNSDTGKFANNYYDLLMSESRMLSYYAIAEGIVPKKHWQALSRTMSELNGYAGSLSWTGTMFEYFMPELFLKCEKGSLGYESLRFAIHCQKHRSMESHIPYGMSESGFFAFDSRLNYQYKAHGVQRLGLKRGLDDEKVVAPYASFLTLPFSPSYSTDNLVKLERMGARHPKYGFYEAVDFTTERLDGQKFGIVKSHMAHHVGMSMVGIANYLNNGVFQKRFFNNPQMNRASELLEEKIIVGEIMFEDYYKKHQQKQPHYVGKDVIEMTELSPFSPRTAILSNGSYTGVYTDVGAYYGIYDGNITITKTEDFLLRPRGAWFALSEKGKLMPFTEMPMQTDMEKSVVFSGTSVEYYANGNDLMSGMRVSLHSEYACEIRRFAVSEKSGKKRMLSLCVFLEPVLSSNLDYEAHPMFMDLFIKIKYCAEKNAIVIMRKKRDCDEKTFMIIGFSEKVKFNYSFSKESVMDYMGGMSEAFQSISKMHTDTDGCVPHPCVSLRADFEIDARKKSTLTMLTLVGSSEEELFSQLDTIRENESEAQDLIENTPERIQLEEMLTNIIFDRYSDSRIALAISENTMQSTELWRFGISGDFPIVSVEIENCTDGMSMERIRTHLKAQNILRKAQIRFDLIFIISQSVLCDMVKHTVAELHLSDNIGKSIFIIDSHDIDKRAKTLIMAMSNVLYLNNPEPIEHISSQGQVIDILPCEAIKPSEESFGHFSENGFEITQKPPRPWCNVLANGAFGTLVSSCSLGFSWALNSRENKLSPWHNDVFSDNRGEMLVLKNKDKFYDIINGSTAEFSPEKAVWKGKCGDIECETIVYTAEKGGAKIMEISLLNNGKEKEIQLAYYIEPVLNANSRGGERTATRIKEDVLMLHNFTNRSYKGAASVSADGAVFLNDRTRFLKGDWDKQKLLQNPNPCGAAIITRKLPPKHTERIRYILSYSENKNTTVKNAIAARNSVPSELNSAVKIKTPDESINSLFNIWLPSQILNGRMRARTGFYQNGGAFGFRDQLQDGMATAIFAPKFAKRQILRACTAQFSEGDVLHWWHVLPNVRKGVRTRYSDDMLWLPFVLCDYIKKTGDYDILDIKTAFSEGDLLLSCEHSKYIEVRKTQEKADVYEHAKRAIENGYKKGSHGLILMGCGDWNDGYNKVGAEGKGESVWLSMFAIMVLEEFVWLSENRGDKEYTEICKSRAKELRKAIDENAWDKTHYLRAYFDNGEKMGGNENSECKIDSLPQAFAVLAELENDERNNLSMKTAIEELVDFENGIIKLFSPSFGEGAKQRAGYVNSYPEGVRENGGQYTHAAVWLTMAALRMGDTENGMKMVSILNPSNRIKDFKKANVFRNEPYFMTADIYTNPTAYGRGGWSIYTGAAGWYYKCIFEELLGIKCDESKILIKPNIPKEWDGFSIKMTIHNTEIELSVYHGDDKHILDNGKIAENIPLDGLYHIVSCVV